MVGQPVGELQGSRTPAPARAADACDCDRDEAELPQSDDGDHDRFKSTMALADLLSRCASRCL